MGAGVSDWVARFYDRKSEASGPSEVLDHHRERAAAIPRLTGIDAGRVLEIGCGAGGAAVATAALGYDVTAVEVSEVRAGLARQLAGDAVRVVHADALVADLGAGYDVVVMWDGFGVEDDAGQRALLRRVARDWLSPSGRCVLDVYDPDYWAAEAGADERDEETGLRERLDFDHDTRRFVDSWWFDGDDAPPAAQSVRCYAPDELGALLDGTGLEQVTLERDPDVPWSYRVVLAPR